MGKVVDLRARCTVASGLGSSLGCDACEQVRRAREQAGLSVPEFAAALRPLLGWTELRPGWVRLWESGEPPPTEVVAACQMLAAQDMDGELADALNLAWGCTPAEVAREGPGSGKRREGRGGRLPPPGAAARLGERAAPGRPAPPPPPSPAAG